LFTEDNGGVRVVVGESSWRQRLKSAISVLGLAGDTVESKLISYIEVLAVWGRVHNLSAEKSEADICDNLVIPSLALGGHLSGFSRVLDLGTGAGIPGGVLALAHPGQSWTLVEKVAKKARFIEHMAYQLSCQNIKVCKCDFTKMHVDLAIGAIVSRGSAKLKQQLMLTQAWREKNIPLFSVQSQESLAAYQAQAHQEKTELKILVQENGGRYLQEQDLVLVKVI
jgi:16S rRNA (guanine527-N7)-methyltransferase